jgi:hypothetical protein
MNITGKFRVPYGIPYRSHSTAVHTNCQNELLCRRVQQQVYQTFCLSDVVVVVRVYIKVKIYIQFDGY